MASSARRPGAAAARALAAAFTLALAPATLVAQLVSPACAETCPNPLVDPSGAAACTTRVTTCQTKLGLYNTYMGQLGAGVSRTPLNALYRQVLGAHISTAILGAYQFGRADRQPPNNSTTDCSVTYYNPSFSAYTERLAIGRLNTDAELTLLLHELAHAEQCAAVGGRDRYAAMWFREMEVAALQSGSLDFAEIHAGVITQPPLGRPAGQAVLHAVADEVVRAAVVHADGHADDEGTLRLAEPWARWLQSAAGPRRGIRM